MKYNKKITLVLLSMFVVTQLIGLYVVNFYLMPENIVPFGMDSPVEAQIQCEINSITDFFKCTEFLPSLLLSFVLAIALLFILTKFKVKFILKVWFFLVMILALGIALNAIIPQFNYIIILVLALAIPLAYIKIYKKNLLIHNLTELLIYPGISVVFIPILNFWSIIILLILISIYDMWAVWHSGIMQKMAKYQINKLNIFAGFFVPFMSDKVREKIKNMKKSELKKKKIKVDVAILGGGDVVFPLIAAGIMLKSFGLIAALLTITGATIALGCLFLIAQKKKFYPAMPFITSGVFLGMLVNWLI